MVTEFLAQLSSSPGSFESDVEYITSIFNDWVTSEELLQELVELIYTEVMDTHIQASFCPLYVSVKNNKYIGIY